MLNADLIVLHYGSQSNIISKRIISCSVGQRCEALSGNQTRKTILSPSPSPSPSPSLTIPLIIVPNFHTTHSLPDHHINHFHGFTLLFHPSASFLPLLLLHLLWHNHNIRKSPNQILHHITKTRLLPTLLWCHLSQHHHCKQQPTIESPPSSPLHITHRQLIRP